MLLAAWGGPDMAFAGTAIVLQPVSASGEHTIIGSDLFLPAGPQRVRLEVRIAGWGTRDLKTVQVKINTSGFDDGAPPITHAVVPCPSNNSAGHTFCAQNLEAGSRCSVGCPTGTTSNCQCESGFQNRNRTDFVGFGLDHIAAVDMSTVDYRFGMTTSPPDLVIDPGTSLYLGTMFLDVPADAQGIYSMAVAQDSTFFQDAQNSPDNNIPISLRGSARIIIGPPLFPGSRYAVFDAGEPGEQTAVRVTLTSLYHPGPPVAAGEDRDFSAQEGQVRWLGPPATFSDAAPDSTFVAAQLQCTPHFTDWGALGTIQMYGDAVIPSSIYTIRQVSISCQADPNDPLCLSPPHVTRTGQWGDAAFPFARSDQAAQPDAADLADIVDAFRGQVDAAPKALTQLRGAIPNPAADVNFLDVDLAVDAVMGRPFPYPVPPSCP